MDKKSVILDFNDPVPFSDFGLNIFDSWLVMLNCEAQSVEKNEAEHKILEIRRIDDQPNTALPRVTRHVTRDRLGLKGIFLSMVRNKLN